MGFSSAPLSVDAAVQLSLETDCCADFAVPLHQQLSSGKYDECSVLEMPKYVLDWRAQHRTARKRADRAARLGYRFALVDPAQHVEDIYAINTSRTERQGRPMSAGYRKRPSASPDPVYTCARHAVRRYGVLRDDTLVAYLWLYRCGELALVSQILGHAEHEPNDVMYLLFQGAVEAQAHLGGFFVYNRHDSGTDGLRYFKERLGFRPMEVEWAL